MGASNGASLTPLSDSGWDAPSSVAPCDKANKTTVAGNSIDIAFDPAQSEKVKKCEKIVHVQFVQKYIDGKVVKPGDAWDGWKYRDKVTTDKGWAVDHLKTEKTPDYQQGKGDGKKNGGTTKATMHDAPTTNGLEDKFYDATKNPNGWKEYRNEFATYSYCMKGEDCGKWYSGLKWKYTQTWEGVRDGKDGTSVVTDEDAGEPAQEQLDAFDKFNKDKGFTPCK